jgi:hypothetical protein
MTGRALVESKMRTIAGESGEKGPGSRLGPDPPESWLRSETGRVVAGR